jgi:hypothetical protein
MMVMPGKIKFIDAYILTRLLLQEPLGYAAVVTQHPLHGAR